MRTLIIGCNGYVGSAVARRLLADGHPVTGLARDGESARRLRAAGVEPLPGPVDLTDIASVADRIRDFDAVVFAPFVPFDDEPPVIETLIDILAGTDKSLIYTSGTGVLSIESREGQWHQENFEEDDPAYQRRHWLSMRIDAENTVRDATGHGVRGIVVRPPLIWGRGGSRQVPAIFESVETTGSACYVGAGLNLYTHVHIDDLAELYRLVMLNGAPGGLYHAVAGEVNWRTLAEAVAEVMGCATKSVTFAEAGKIWGDLVADLYFGVSSRSRAVRSRTELGWAPTRLDLVEDIRTGSYRDRYQVSG